MATQLLHMSEKNGPLKYSKITENSQTQVCYKLMCDPTVCVCELWFEGDVKVKRQWGLNTA